MNRTSKLTIGVLSESTAVNVETIRYYERIGLLPKPPRSPGGHRYFADEHKQRLVFFRHARELGFPLVQVRTLLGLVDSRRLTRAKVKRITEQHIAEIRRKVKALRRLERILCDMVSRCRGDETSDCPILDALTESGT
jgi:MerR family transcriptional regulator, mercuric resistance operon regulatory protein